VILSYHVWARDGSPNKSFYCFCAFANLYAERNSIKVVGGKGKGTRSTCRKYKRNLSLSASTKVEPRKYRSDKVQHMIMTLGRRRKQNAMLHKGMLLLTSCQLSLATFEIVKFKTEVWKSNSTLSKMHEQLQRMVVKHFYKQMNKTKV